jgi:hypothetical protein
MLQDFHKLRHHSFSPLADEEPKMHKKGTIEMFVLFSCMSEWSEVKETSSIRGHSIVILF